MAAGTAEERFQALFEAYHRAILGYFYRRLEPDQAFDAAEEVFLVAWRKLERVPTGEEALKWLYGVAQRVLANHERTNRRSVRLITRLAHAPQPQPPGPESLVVRRSEEQAVLDAMTTLKPRDREVLRLAFWDELPHADIARMLGCSRNAVDVRIHRSIKRLQKEFERTGHRRREWRETQHEESEAW